MIAALLPEPPLLKPGEDDRSAGQWTISRRAMACDFTVHLHSLTSNPVAVAEAALLEIEALEELLSVYRPDSELSRLNREAFDRPVRVDGRLFAILQRSAELYEQTARTFDIATGSLIEAWGFFRGPRRVPSPDEHAAAMAAAGMRHVELNPTDLTVRYRTPGLKINLGSIGKGYAIDRAVQRMRSEFGTESVLLTGGSSSMYAGGSLTGDESGWLIGIEDPLDATRTVATVRLRNRALGTSSTSNQYFTHDGQRYGHLLDPRTGRPADALAGVSVLAPDAATADALATAFFVAGLDKTADFCHNHPEIAAVIVLKEAPAGERAVPERRGPRVVTFNLSSQDVKIATGGTRMGTS